MPIKRIPISVSVFFYSFILSVVALQGWFAYRQLMIPTGGVKSMNTLGTINSIPHCNHHGCRFQWVIQKNHINPLSAHLLVYWYGRHLKLKAGQQWYLSLHCRYCDSSAKRPFWLLAKGDISTATVETKKIHFLSQRVNPGVWLGLRTTLQQAIKEAVTQPALAAFLTALAIGSRALLSQANWTVFQNTGTSHLVAISGLHVGFIFWFCRSFFRWLFSRRTAWIQKVPACLAANWGALLFSMVYSELAGLSLPTQRALIMLLIMVVPSACGRHVPVWRRVLLAFVVMIMINPLSLLQMGFWLSFCAVASILYCAVDSKASNKGWVWLKMQLGLTFLLLPLTLYDFSKVSVVSMMANAVAVPWVTFAAVPGAFVSTMVLLCSHSLGGFCFKLMSWVLAPLWWYLSFLSNQSYALLKVYPISSAHVLCYSEIGFLLLFSPRGVPGRCIGLLWLCPLLSLHWTL